MPRMSDKQVKEKNLYIKNEVEINAKTGAVEQWLHDKSHLGPEGEWQDEPDRVSFHHAGFPCLMKRNPYLGFWCGYVGVPANHPAHGKDYDNVEASVHGGLTYANDCSGEPDKGICHKTENGDHAWWFGFDCGHLGDIVPTCVLNDIYKPISREETYKNYAYVMAETEKLASQLAALWPKEITHDKH